MRGTLVTCPSEWVMAGIIPAYAGNTRLVALAVPVVGDHPRVCGEHMFPCRWIRVPSGSSPRMRGTLLDDPVAFRYGGIIPAYAGNTSCVT